MRGEENRQQFTDIQGLTLIRLARLAIRSKLNGVDPERDADFQTLDLSDLAFEAKRGVFVTLKIKGHLRGCIGSLTAAESVVDGVRRNAVNAAFYDPRFPSLTEGELAQAAIEVSVLSEPQPLAYRDGDDLLAKLRVDEDGVIVRKETAGATFLPQVWEQLPRPRDFLGHLCMKAGLPADAWQTMPLEVSTYQVQYFEEE